MSTNKMKEGFSVKEMQEFTKKHRFEVFFCLAFVFAVLFNSAVFGSWLSILLGGAGGILGALFHSKVESGSQRAFSFIFKQAPATQLVLGIFVLVIAIFIPAIIFFLMGLHGGISMHHFAQETSRRS